MNFKEYRHRSSACPVCFSHIDTSMETQAGSGPSAGDVSICMKCGAINIFRADMTLRLATTGEEAEVMRESGALIRRLRREVRRRG